MAKKKTQIPTKSKIEDISSDLQWMLDDSGADRIEITLYKSGMVDVELKYWGGEDE